MEWVACIAVAVLVALGLRYAVGKMQESAREYRDAIIRDEIESVRGWLESKRQPPHG